MSHISGLDRWQLHLFSLFGRNLLPGDGSSMLRKPNDAHRSQLRHDQAYASWRRLPPSNRGSCGRRRFRTALAGAIAVAAMGPRFGSAREALIALMEEIDRVHD